MSCNITKIVLRAEFPHLQGKSRNEVYPFYLDILGEPSDIDEYDGKVDYFEYEGKYQPVHDYDNDRWGIDLILHHESDYKTYIEMNSNGLTLDEFNKLANSMSQAFCVDKYKIRIISYSWYSGADEPIRFD
jgi:hypothetical protein